MRLKTITARSMPEALAQLKEEFGPEALIIRTDESRSSVRITVAIEGRRGTAHLAKSLSEKQTPARRPAFRDNRTAELLAHHGVPFELAMRIQTAAAALDRASLAGALDICFRFQPLSIVGNQPLMLVGPAGGGKTLAVKKLELALATPGQEPRLIDSKSVNPLRLSDMEQLTKIVRASGAEPVLVLPAGLEPLEAAETAQIFAALGARRMIASRLDTCRRLGSVLSAASAGDFMIAAFGRSPNPRDRLEPATASELAKLLIQLTPASKAAAPEKKAVG